MGWGGGGPGVLSLAQEVMVTGAVVNGRSLCSVV